MCSSANNSLMLGQTYQLQIANGLNDWTSVGSAFFATNGTWASPDYWNVTDSSAVFFRLQIVP
jgi:hypothetical protein